MLTIGKKSVSDQVAELTGTLRKLQAEQEQLKPTLGPAVFDNDEKKVQEIEDKLGQLDRRIKLITAALGEAERRFAAERRQEAEAKIADALATFQQTDQKLAGIGTEVENAVLRLSAALLAWRQVCAKEARVVNDLWSLLVTAGYRPDRWYEGTIRMKGGLVYERHRTIFGRSPQTPEYLRKWLMDATDWAVRPPVNGDGTDKPPKAQWLSETFQVPVARCESAVKMVEELTKE